MDPKAGNPRIPKPTIGALIVRIGFGGVVHDNYNKEPQGNSYTSIPNNFRSIAASRFGALRLVAGVAGRVILLAVGLCRVQGSSSKKAPYYASPVQNGLVDGIPTSQTTYHCQSPSI